MPMNKLNHRNENLHLKFDSFRGEINNFLMLSSETKFYKNLSCPMIHLFVYFNQNCSINFFFFRNDKEYYSLSSIIIYWIVDWTRKLAFIIYEAYTRTYWIGTWVRFKIFK